MKKIIWLVLLCLSIISIACIYKYFDKAFPFVRLSVTMSAHEAQTQAKIIAQKHDWQVDDFYTAVNFRENNKLQAFVELEGGGKQAYLDMIDHDYHQPYTWVVRFYKPAEVKEYFVAFTPQGRMYEFSIKVPEHEEGAVLRRDQALGIAKQGAFDWNVDLTLYEFIEYHNQIQPNGRVDHVFVYQRNDIALQDGLYQLKLKVSGDTFSGIDRYIKIPDEFDRRYQQMFAQNKLIAVVALYVGIFIYLFIIAFLIMLFFYRNTRYLFIRSYGYMALIFGTILMLASLNMMPLWWNCYQTHSSEFIFLLMRLGSSVLSIMVFAIFVWCINVIAQASDRYIFAKHLQFLKLWTPVSGGSRQVFEQTILGYVGAVLMLGYQIGYNMLTVSWGWWSPLSRLVDPNVLLGYIPAFSPFAMSMQAGFFEEIAFRVLPLAGIALITRNFKNKAWWFWGMFVLQAIIFGAMHATYPQQPAYNRIVELMLPSFGFGLLYYYFGVLPGVVMHFVYDAIIFNIPIWTSDLWSQKIVAVGLIAIPLLVVLFYWIRQNRKLINAPVAAYNDSVEYQEPDVDTMVLSRDLGLPLTHLKKVWLLVFSAVGLLCLFYSQQWNFITPPLIISGQQAQAIAADKIEQLSISVGDNWTVIQNYVEAVQQPGNKFIWQTYGQKEYQNLEGSYLLSGYWVISWKKFIGPVEDRAEEIQVVIDNSGIVRSFRHSLPEYQSGADLSEREALHQAEKQIDEWYGLSRKQLQVISSESKKLSARRDWMIKYKDISVENILDGQCIILIKLAGDKLAEVHRTIQAPEVWLRQNVDYQMKIGIIKTILFILLMIIIAIAGLIVFVRCRRFDQLLKSIGIATLVLFGIRIINCCNGWYQILVVMNTTEPLLNQIVTLSTSILVGYLAFGFMFAALITLLVMFSRRCADRCSYTKYITLVLVGVGIAGIGLLLNGYQILDTVYAPCMEYINFVNTTLALCLAYYCSSILSLALFVMALCVIADKLKNSKMIWTLLLFLLGGILMVDFVSMHNIPLWLGMGLLVGFIWYFLYYAVLIHDTEAVMFMAFGIYFVKFLPAACYGAYPMIMGSFAVSSIIILMILIGLYRKN